MNNNQYETILINNDNTKIVKYKPFYYKNCLMIIGLTIIILLLCFVSAVCFFYLLYRTLPF